MSIKLTTGHQSLQQLLRRSRSNKKYRSQITRWPDRKSPFDVKVQRMSASEKNSEVTRASSCSGSTFEMQVYGENVYNALISFCERSERTNQLSLKKMNIRDNASITKANGRQQVANSVTERTLGIFQTELLSHQKLSSAVTNLLSSTVEKKRTQISKISNMSTTNWKKNENTKQRTSCF